MNNLNDANDKPNGIGQSKIPGRADDQGLINQGRRGPSQSEIQSAIACARLMPIAALMQQLGGRYVSDENALGESVLCLQVDCARDENQAVCLLAHMDKAGLAPSVVVVEHGNAHFDAKTGCVVYGPLA